MKIFILEDSMERVRIFNATLGPKHDIVQVDTASKAIEWLQKQEFDVIFLDHDLGGQPPMYYGIDCDISNANTGSEVVRWMLSSVEFEFPELIIIHSVNVPAAKDMQQKLNDAQECAVHYIPFNILSLNYLVDPNFLKRT